MTYYIGLTGTIASGKSTIAAYFKTLNIDVVNADDIAKTLTKPDTPVFKEIIRHVGSSVLNSQGELNRRYLRELIVQSPTERLWLEGLLHPLIRERIQNEITQCKTPYCMIEIPLLTDRLTYPYLNRVLLVTASRDSQIKRLMARDQCTNDAASAMIDTSLIHEQARRAISDDILVNDGNLTELKKRLSLLHKTYLELASKTLMS